MASSGDLTEEEVKKYIKGILTSNPLVSTIQSIQKDYRDLIGSSIPFYKFKYNSVEHFLKSITDTCVVHGTGSFAQVTPIVSEKSAHINKMVTQQKVNVGKGRRKPMAPRRNARPMGYFGTNPNRPPPNRRPPSYNFAISPNSSSSSSSIGYATVPTRSAPTNNYAGTNGIAGNTNAPNKTIDQTRNTNTVGSTYGGGPNVNVNRLGHRTENTEEKRNYILEQNSLESKRVKERLDNLIKQQVELGNAAQRPVTSTPMHNDTNSLNRVDSSNIPDNAPMLDKNMSRYLTISSKETSNEHTKETSDLYQDNCLNRSKERLKNLLSESKHDDELDDEDTSNVPRRVQDNLRNLINQFNDGIWCSDVPTEYRKLFNKELMYMEYGYSSLIEMCISLKHIFHYVRPGKDDFKLYDRSKPLPESVEKLYTIASFDKGDKVPPNQALPELSWSDFSGHVPDDIFKYGNEIPNQFLPEGTKVENILDVVVVEIYDPSKFWFYLGTSESADLDELMDDLQNFYNVPENANEYAIPRGALREGLYCVQVIYGEYHRARIVRVLPDKPDYVRVLYIDYGTVCKAPIKGLCFLHFRFSLLNAQAIRCRLANIAPTLKGHPWPRSASDRFRELVNRRDTKIKISYIDWNEEYVCVFLADVTEKDSAVYINEVLVKEGHAIWDNESPTVPFVLSNFKCKVQNIHLFPTFLELEYGLAPNSGEMYSLEDTLVPLQFCIPQYFEPDDQIISSEDESGIEQIENAFVDTVKNHRKFTQLNKVDVSSVLKPPPIDFNIFGDLKDEMIEFCKKEGVGDGVQDQEGDSKQEEQLFCDIDEDDPGANAKDFDDIERATKTSGWLRLPRENREISEDIIEKLGKYSLSCSENPNSGSSEIASGERDNLDTFSKCDSKEYWSAEEAIDDLSTIMEQSEMDVTVSEPESPKNKFLGFLNMAPSRSDVNIFDNPEEFESSSSDKTDSDRPVSPESFLKTIERFTKKDLEEENILEESTSTTGNSSSVGYNSDNPFKFDINADLKEAFKKYLESKKPGNDRDPSFLKCDTADEETVSRRGGGETDSAVSFLRFKDWKKIREAEKDHLKEEEEGGIKDNLNLEDTTGSFLASIGLNNPFRSYLQVKPKRVVRALSVSSEEDNDHKKTPEKLDSNDNTRTDLLEVSSILKNDVDLRTLSMQTSDSEGSEYSAFVPRKSQPMLENVSKEESLGSWVKSTIMRKDMEATSSGNESPPRMFTPTAFVPMGYPPYPQWSGEGGFPVPQYPQWSSGGGYPGPCYPRPRESMGPPPGFGYQMRCPPQQYPPAMNPYMAPRMMPPTPIYPGWSSSPMFFTQPRPGPPSRQPEKDFYDRYNEHILRGLKKS